MRKKLNITEGIFPMPVLMVATYNEDNSVNVMNAAWGTMQARDTVALQLTETHKTVQNIKARKAFTISIADAAHVGSQPDAFVCMRLERVEKVLGNFCIFRCSVGGLDGEERLVCHDIADHVDNPS